MHDELSTKIREISGNLKTELLQANAMDKDNNVINPEIFTRILEEKKKKLYALFDLVEEEWGEVKDKYGFQILTEEINILEAKIKYQSWTLPDDLRQEYYLEKAIKYNEFPDKPESSDFKDGIRRLLDKIRKKFGRTSPDTSRD